MGEVRLDMNEELISGPYERANFPNCSSYGVLRLGRKGLSSLNVDSFYRQLIRRYFSCQITAGGSSLFFMTQNCKSARPLHTV